MRSPGYVQMLCAGGGTVVGARVRVCICPLACGRLRARAGAHVHMRVWRYTFGGCEWGGRVDPVDVIDSV